LNQPTAVQKMVFSAHDTLERISPGAAETLVLADQTPSL